MGRGQKMLTGLALAAFITAVPGIRFAYAAGWSDDNGSWQYLNNDGTAVTEQWKRAGDDWYYLNSVGQMEQNSLFQVGDDYFYAGEDGKMVRECWMSFKAEAGNDYELEEYWYYFGSDGKALRKRNSAFKKNIHENIYIFDENGIMLTGFINEEGEMIADETPFIEAKYYCGEDGAMYRERWLEYDYQGEGGMDLRSVMAGKDYWEYGTMWLYFDSAGKKLKSRNTERVRQKTIDGITYGFDDNGVMMSWWSKTATESNASDSNASGKFYSGYDGGKLLENTWVWMYPSEELDADDYSMEEHSWWRTDSRGKVYRDCIREVKGLKYAFDDIGRMQTGFLLYDGSRTFVAQYDIDAWESDDFRNGVVYGIENADLYLFGPDELNGGSMQKGKDISVELADGVYTFGFRANGKAYGNRNMLARINDSYYINGLKLEADNDLRYGVVKVSDDEYRVVNTSGKMVKGKRKLVRDGDDGWYIIMGGMFKTYVSDSDKPRWRKGDSGWGYYSYDKYSKTYDELLASADSDMDDSELPGDAKLNYE